MPRFARTPRSRGWRVALALALTLAVAGPAAAAEDARPQVFYDLEVEVRPADHWLRVEARLLVEGSLVQDREALRIGLHGGLTPRVLDEGWRLEAAPSDGPAHGVPVRTWILRREDGTALPVPLEVRLGYEGVIDHPVKAEGEEYARSFSRTPGIIGVDGVVLTRASWWIPHVGESLLSFRLAVTLPEGWESVSQGARTGHERAEGQSRATWDCRHPMEEVYLIAAPFTEYSRPAGQVTAQAFLRTPDENLAAKYLEATAQYVEMYRRLIGPYPFRKFALVENFWETGYGMPSFTLLGPRVIRFPFILHSSYPHEILHNWWGNSVYVDWETGNWCEGLTAYLADHLIKEGQGRGVEYRRDTLKKYRSYVRGKRDFPLKEFRSRHSGATEAIGYGKSLMLFHMLRRRLGDATFEKGLQTFYRRHLWTQASFDDLAKTFSSVSEEDLSPFFRQWVERTGAPELALSVASSDEGRLLRVGVRQVQEEDPFTVDVPLAVTLQGRPEALVFPLHLAGRRSEFTFELPAPAVRLDLDPRFDAFRRLDLAETPPTLGQLFGANRVTLVLPTAEEDPLAPAWKTFAETWSRGGGGQVEIVTSGALETLPGNRAVWILGAGNAWRKEVQGPLEEARPGGEAQVYEFGTTRVPRADHSAVFVVRHPADPQLALGWISTEVEAALPGLARKLPHYGKYSYLAFSGTAPDNVVKGTWPAIGSPLTIDLSLGEGGPPPRGTLEKRQPLARLAPVFAPERLAHDVETLAADEMEGRGVGTQGIEKAADHVAAAMEAAGLQPGGDDGTFFQTFEVPGGPGGEPARLRNVIGILPGTNPAWKGQSVVLGAHYDHLGRGWPDVRQGNAGQLHPGADDNASGVAVLLEVARILARQHKPGRSIVFAAFSGEEWGLKGSRHYVSASTGHPAKQALAMVNLDTVGRLRDQKLLVLGSACATEWRHIAMGVGYTTGVESNCVPEDPEGSDQVAFREAGIPAVQLFTGGHGDYHRPTDTVDKIDWDGLLKVATFVRETLVYLSQRDAPLTSTLGAPRGGTPADTPPAKPPQAGARRVTLGTVPAFDHRGAGLKVQSVVEGSPAEKAGIRAGDLVVAMNGRAIEGLRAFGQMLRKHAPGDVVKLQLRRGEEDLEVEATLAAR